MKESGVKQSIVSGSSSYKKRLGFPDKDYYPRVDLFVMSDMQIYSNLTHVYIPGFDHTI